MEEGCLSDAIPNQWMVLMGEACGLWSSMDVVPQWSHDNLIQECMRLTPEVNSDKKPDMLWSQKPGVRERITAIVRLLHTAGKAKDLINAILGSSFTIFEGAGAAADPAVIDKEMRDIDKVEGFQPKQGANGSFTIQGEG